MRHTFDSEQWLPYPVELVFLVFSNPENLPRLMPPWQKARIEEASFAPPPSPPAGTQTPRRGVIAGPGTRLTMSFRPIPFSPVRIPWDAEIVDFIWNQQFCDGQHRGPFANWKHCHRVVERNDPSSPTTLKPGTLLHDHVDYEAPLGRLGDIAHALVLKRQLASTFRFRHRRTRELLATAIAGSRRLHSGHLRQPGFHDLGHIRSHSLQRRLGSQPVLLPQSLDLAVLNKLVWPSHP